MTKQSYKNGFTLIELVCVITILGILAATAIPRFMSLGEDARRAKVNAMAGALHSAAMLWNVACLLEKQSTCLTGGTAISRNGLSVSMFRGYPNAGDNIGVDQIDVTVNTGGFVVTRPHIFVTQFAVPDVKNADKCAVTYCENNTGGPAANCADGTYRVVANTTDCS